MTSVEHAGKGKKPQQDTDYSGIGRWVKKEK
jgi:hypothetical protein